MARPKVYKLKGSFGEFDGAKIYYLGFDKQPSFLPKSGRGFGGLKLILQRLKGKFKKFTLTITQDIDSVTKVGNSYKIRLSAKAIKRLGQRRWDGNTEMNARLGGQLLAEAFPKYFDSGITFFTYKKGMFSDVLNDSAFDPRSLSQADRAAITKLITGQTLNEAQALDVSAAYESSKDVQLLYLKRLVTEVDAEIANGHDESWWQTYFSQNILFFQNNYIKRLPKMNIVVAGTQFPDFAVVTSDGYLDIIEIKRPGTTLLKEDTSRHNFYWSQDIAKAISQVENYIDNIVKMSDAICVKLHNEQGIDLKIIKPRGIIIAGKSSDFSGSSKKADDFRRLNEGLKNVRVLPYDELSQNLKNTIVSIEHLSQASELKPTKKVARKKEKITS
jgi:hypothetical protein